MIPFYYIPNVFSPEYVIYKNPSSSLCESYICKTELLVEGMELFTKRKIACSEESFIRFLITNINWPMVKSHGTKYLLLSKSVTFDFFAFSQIIGIRSGYF